MINKLVSYIEMIKKELTQSLNNNVFDEVMDKIGNPTPKSKLLPYSYYDKENEIFYSGKDTVGFILKCDPIVGCDPDQYKQIALLFEDYLPQGGCLQTLLLASDDLKDPLNKWLNSRIRDGEVYRKLESYRINFYREYNKSNHNNFKLRNYELFFSFSMNVGKKKSLNEVLEFKEKLLSQLASMGLNPRILQGDGLLRLVKELINYPIFEDVSYSEVELISNQISDTSINLLVSEDGILHDGGEFITKCYEVKTFPEVFSIGQIPWLLGDSDQDSMQVPARFAINYIVSNDISNPAQEGLKIKGEQVVEQSKSMLAKLSNTLLEEGKEWQEILSENLKKRKERFLTAGLSVMVTATRDQISKVDQRIVSLWKKNDFYLKESKYFHLPALLGLCPFMPSIGISKTLKRFNMTRTVLSSEAKALLPIHAEWKGSYNGGMLLSGTKGQLFSWDSFGGSNPNVFIVGESGSGKSVFLQEYVVSQLAKGARVFVIDIGRSFEKTCKILGGDFIYFGSGSKISLNPFGNIPRAEYKEAKGTEEATNLTQDSLSILKFVIAKMVAPKSGTVDIQDALIAKSLFKVWDKYKNEANIDKLSEVLTIEEERGRDLALMLFEFTTKGSYGKFFSGEANVEFRKDFTVLEFEELRERPDLGGVIMQMLAIQIVQQVYLSDRKQRFIILFDEAWYALKHFPQMLSSMARTVRKYNGALVLATQSLTDVYGAEEGESNEDDKARVSVIENCSWRVLLKQKSDSAEKAKRIGLDKGQIELLKNLQAPTKDYSESLIYQSNKEYFVGRLMLDPFSQVLYSSRPDVFSAVQALLKEGVTTADAIETVMRKLYEKA
jgi:conjugal transfer ATP-binding protein TraC